MAFSGHRSTPPGLAEALRNFRRAAKRKPTDADRPPPSTFSGRQPRRITGQLELGEHVDLHATEDDESERHSARFREIGNRYPRRVAEASGGDLGRAAADDDEQVSATVAAWERAQGLEPVDWYTVGAAEREETPAA
jgi:hypothetical protein